MQGYVMKDIFHFKEVSFQRVLFIFSCKLPFQCNYKLFDKLISSLVERKEGVPPQTAGGLASNVNESLIVHIAHTH